MATITETTLKNVGEVASDAIGKADAQLQTELASIPDDPGKVTTAILLKVQVAMAKYTVTSSVLSAIIKEMADALKSLANKIG